MILYKEVFKHFFQVYPTRILQISLVLFVMFSEEFGAISWMVSSFKFLKIFFKFPFIECGIMAPSASTMTGIVSVFISQILVISAFCPIL